VRGRDETDEPLRFPAVDQFYQGIADINFIES
jgi:hypothetical protein